jgi:NAD(P)-dependent dehydrogenase (short-subunit alcohol dehydrogenase family)
LEVNVVGQLAVTQAFLPALRYGPGRIVNISSISGLTAGPYVGGLCSLQTCLGIT